MISFRNIQHAIATFFQAVVKDLPKVESVIEKVESAAPVVEAVSGIAANAFAPGSGILIADIEKAAFAALSAVDVALKSGGAAAEQKLLDAGLDQKAIDAAKAVGVASVAVYTVVKSAQK